MKLSTDDLKAILASRIKNSEIYMATINCEQIADWLIETEHVTEETLDFADKPLVAGHE